MTSSGRLPRRRTNFAQKEILPAADAIEAKDYKVTRALLAKAGELGLMAIDMPEEYGGLAMDKVTSAIVGERLSVLGSFATTFSAQSGIGMLPIVWYGTPEQKQKYLPKLVTGEWIGAYALSEASSGSDAMNCGPARCSRLTEALHPERRKDVDHQRRVLRISSRYSPRSMVKSSRRF